MVSSTTTEIEKKNLEAHVELCAERYKSLDNKLDTVEQRVSGVEKKLELKMIAVETALVEIKDLIAKKQDQRNNQLIKWGIGIIGSLLSVCGFLLWHFID